MPQLHTGSIYLCYLEVQQQRQGNHTLLLDRDAVGNSLEG